jgi:hypothetical protein
LFQRGDFHFNLHGRIVDIDLVSPKMSLRLKNSFEHGISAITGTENRRRGQGTITGLGTPWHLGMERSAEKA